MLTGPNRDTGVVLTSILGAVVRRLHPHKGFDDFDLAAVGLPPPGRGLLLTARPLPPRDTTEEKNRQREESDFSRKFWFHAGALVAQWKFGIFERPIPAHRDFDLNRPVALIRECDFQSERPFVACPATAWLFAS
jgi:hypothetical protein